MNHHPYKKLIQTTKTARYFYTSIPTNHTRLILVALHGYAQHAAEFLNQLTPLASETCCIVAPEGLNKFYAKGMRSNPVATWMTSDERESEIADYVAYLTLVYQDMVPPDYSGKIAILGFSQGVATASRWIVKANLFPTAFIICSGEIAFEYRNPVHHSIKNIPLLFYVTGNADPLLDETAKLAVIEVLNQLNYTHCEFEGGHNLHLPSIEKIIAQI
jgi:predicted esterase